jgi:hypothetical protein
MKIMGKVAWLILVVVVSLCVVFCVLCCFQNNPVFLSVTIFHILKKENYELCFLTNLFVDQITTGKTYEKEKKDCVSFWQLFSNVTIFHVLKNENYELCFLAGFFVDEIMTGKNYDRKKVLC